MNERPSLPEYFLKMAQLVSTRTTCLRRAVGCVLVNKKGHVLSTGYNDAPSGHAHCFDAGYCVAARHESGKNLDQCVAVHAEENALIQCKDVFDIDVCYVTTFPCKRCLRMLQNTSCEKIIYLEPYGDCNPGDKIRAFRYNLDPKK